MGKEIINLYEKFLKDNKLILGNESAKEFCDLYENNYEIEMLSDEYVQKCRDLKTRKARFLNYKKAYLISSDNIIAKILMYDSKRNKLNDLVDIKDIPDCIYDKNINYIDFLKDELNLEYTYLLTNNIYNPNQDLDLYNLGYRARAYLWVMRVLYFQYIGNYMFEDAIQTGEKILALNKRDSFDILLTLPYLYLNLDDLSGAIDLLNRVRIDSADLLLLRSVTAYFDSDLDKSISNLKKLSKLNSNVLKFITINYDPENLEKLINDDKSYDEASTIYAGFILMGDDKTKEFRQFVIKHIDEIDKSNI